MVLLQASKAHKYSIMTIELRSFGLFKAIVELAFKRPNERVWAKMNISQTFSTVSGCSMYKSLEKKAGFLIVMDVLDHYNSRLLHPNNRPRALHTVLLFSLPYS